MHLHTQPNDLCYEPFSGSGSQLIAAEQLGRRCYAIELEPRFVDVAIVSISALGTSQTVLGYPPSCLRSTSGFWPLIQPNMHGSCAHM